MVVDTIFAAINTSFTLISEGDQPTEQWYDATEDVEDANDKWHPNHVRYPVILTPVMSVDDPDGMMNNSPAPASIQWIEYRETDNSATARGTVISSGTEGYTLAPAGFPYSLKVTKNFSTNERVRIVCKATYVNTKDNSQFYGDASAVFLCEPAAAAPLALTVDNVANKQYYHPLRGDNPQKTMSVKLSRGNSDVSGSYFWYVDNNGTLTPVTADDVFYVSGLGTGSLTVNADCLPTTCFTVKGAGTQNAESPDGDLTPVSFFIHREIGRIQAITRSKDGDALKPSMSGMTFDALIQENGFDIDEDIVSEYITLNWKHKQTNKTQVSDAGWGLGVTIPYSTMKTDTYNVCRLVWPVIYVLSELQALTYDNATLTYESETVLGRT